MREFVCEQLSAGDAAGPIFVRGEDDLPPEGKGTRTDHPRRRCRRRVGMDPHTAQIKAETGLEEIARTGLQWMPWRAQRISDDRRRLAGSGRGRAGRLVTQRLRLRIFAL